MNSAEIDDIKGLIPTIIIDNYYTIVALNSSATKMFGNVIGKKCFNLLFGFDSPCYQKDITCPIYNKTIGIDTITLDLEVYLRSYGNIPLGGLFYESVINITKVEFIRSAILDPLTGIYNRRFMENFLDKTFHLWKRYNQIFCVISVDIDHLKEINDRYGHLAGDEAIIKVSTCLKTSIRDSDAVGRIGGDEFLIILPNTTLKDAESVAIRIVNCINKIRFIAPVSLSIGLTEVSKDDESFKQIIERADKALYKVKKSERGKIAVLKAHTDTYFIEINKNSVLI